MAEPGFSDSSDPTALTIIEVIQRLFPAFDSEGVLEAIGEPAAADQGPEADTQTDQGVDPPTPPYTCWHSKVPRSAYAETADFVTDAECFISPPVSPFDVFAVAAYLLELSGAYHHFVPAPPHSEPQGHKRRVVKVKADDTLLKCCEVGKRWRAHLEPSSRDAIEIRAGDLEYLMEAWDRLVGKHGTALVYEELDQNVDPPEWWLVALELLIMADEASAMVGFEPLDLTRRQGWDWVWFMRDFEIAARRKIANRQRDETDFALLPDSLSAAANDVVCVLPKARTSPVGCTLRSLSHHLALVKARGIARGRWTPLIRAKEGGAGAAAGEDTEFNLLLVPFPYSITEQEFRSVSAYDEYQNDWRFFEVRQSWRRGYFGPFRRAKIAELLTEMVENLAGQAISLHGAKRIDAVVFPELALDHALFKRLCSLLPQRLPHLRLLIAGLSSYERRDEYGTLERRTGNFVGVADFDQGQFEFETVREKHHRWMLNRAQINSYGLAGVLDPRCEWWENLDLLSRRVDFTVFRERSVLAAMICEDLARVDPCQELLRAVGPNLVVALLMDAPQLCTRWPARYATILAEDPGSSVLTLTSRALMTRQMLIGTWPQQQPKLPVIALWRDDYHGVPEQIECPIGSHAVWLRLWGRRARDKTLDGRTDATAVSWIRALWRPLAIRGDRDRFKAILGAEDIELERRWASGELKVQPQNPP